MTATSWLPSTQTLEHSLIAQLRSGLDLDGEHQSFSDWLYLHFPHMVWDKPHHQRILEALDKLNRGDITKLMLFVPPRHGKSQMVTVRYTSWWLENHPDQNVILAAYNQTLAEKFSRQIRRIVRERTPLNVERSAVNEWETNSGGGLRAAGVGGGITGMGGNLIVIDDPIRGREEADSPAYRERLWEWYQDDLYTRREPGAKMILIQTRWHQDDLAGRILQSEDAHEWTKVHIPAIAMEDDPLGREVGAALWPERMPASEIQKLRAFNERGYWALYQGMPQPEGGAIILRDWWDDPANRYDISDPAPRNLTVARYQHWDTAEEKNASSAFTTCTTWDLMPDYTLHLRDVYRERLRVPELLPAVERQAKRHNRDEKLADIVIEYASSGRGLYQTITASSPDWLREKIRRYQPRDSKVDRAKAASVWMAAGLVRLPFPHESAPWLHDYEQELYSFPSSQFADQVDSTTQAINYMKHYLALAIEARGMALNESAV